MKPRHFTLLVFTAIFLVACPGEAPLAERQMDPALGVVAGLVDSLVVADSAMLADQYARFVTESPELATLFSVQRFSFQLAMECDTVCVPAQVLINLNRDQRIVDPPDCDPLGDRIDDCFSGPNASDPDACVRAEIEAGVCG